MGGARYRLGGGRADSSALRTYRVTPGVLSFVTMMQYFQPVALVDPDDVPSMDAFSYGEFPARAIALGELQCRNARALGAPELIKAEAVSDAHLSEWVARSGPKVVEFGFFDGGGQHRGLHGCLIRIDGKAADFNPGKSPKSFDSNLSTKVLGLEVDDTSPDQGFMRRRHFLTSPIRFSAMTR